MKATNVDQPVQVIDIIGFRNAIPSGHWSIDLALVYHRQKW